MKNSILIFRGFSPPKAGIGIFIAIVIAMMSMSSSRTYAAARADVPDVTKTAVCALPDYTVSSFTIVNEGAESGSPLGVQQMAKSAASQEVRIDGLSTAKNSGERESRIEDLQATIITVPPLISRYVVNKMEIQIPVTTKSAKIFSSTTTREGFARYDIVATSSVNFSLIQFVATTADLQPGDIQIKRPIASTATAKTYNLGSMVVRA